MTAVEGLLSMAVLKDKCLPQTTHQRIEHIHESLLFYDEHTFEHPKASVIRCAKQSGAMGEKSAYAWKQSKNTNAV